LVKQRKLNRITLPEVKELVERQQQKLLMAEAGATALPRGE